MKKRQFKLEVVLSAIQEYVDGQTSQRTIAEQVGISLASFQAWISKYQSMGIAAFTRNSNKCYSQELKEQAVKEEHEEHRYPIKALCQLGKVSRAAYYKWLHRENPAYEAEKVVK